MQQALELSWSQIVARHGVPLCGSGSSAPRQAGVAVIAYGKFGGIELGYGSDLDLVFVHDSAGDVQSTAGPTVVENSVFFLRLVQRLVHLLTMHSAAGRLYEVDTRLRPSGKGGLLVQNIDAFRDYQQREAWTWEHQALLRARAGRRSARAARALRGAARRGATDLRAPRSPARGRAQHARAHAHRALRPRRPTSSISSRIAAVSRTSSSWRSTGRSSGPRDMRRS